MFELVTLPQPESVLRSVVNVSTKGHLDVRSLGCCLRLCWCLRVQWGHAGAGSLPPGAMVMSWPGLLLTVWVYGTITAKVFVDI